MSSSDGQVAISLIKVGDELYKRLQNLREFYCLEYGSEPEFFARVPGRVNLIGEHVDYCGYPVLPMAINQCIILAVGRNLNENVLKLKNFDGTKFSDYVADLTQINIELPKSGGPEWYKYYLCGIKGIQETLGDNFRAIGMNIAVHGNVPPAAGLSSSSAMVSAAVLATAHIQNMLLNRKQLASISASCECYIGTHSGGMDQAIAYLGSVGCAQFIEFHPKLNATPIALPKGAVFVVANSLAESNKAASSHYNERVIECRLGARWIAKASNLNNWRNLIRIVDVQEALNCSLDELEALANKYLTKTIYTREDICQALNVSAQEFEQQFLTANTQHMEKFKVRQRTLHVIQESLRVLRFREICQQQQQNAVNGNVPKISITEQVRALGQLMRESHISLRDLYECSHSDLERLIAISDAEGVCARVTGAGWGGCIVALCDSVQSSAKYIDALKTKYFSQLPAHLLERYQPNDFIDVVFATSPGSGAEILYLPNC